MNSAVAATLWLAQRSDYDFRDPTRFQSGQWKDTMVAHPVTLVAVAGAAAALVWLPRRLAVVPILIILVLIPASHRIVVASIDFQFLRILGLAAMVRFWMRGDFRKVRWNAMDLAVLAFGVIPVFTAIPRGAGQSLMNVAGQGFDLISMYLIGRILMRDRKDWQVFAIANFVLALPVLVAFSIEKSTGRNYFSIFGGVDEITPVRFGKIRAQGAFAHSILAGVWWAALVPIFISMARVAIDRNIGRLLATLGVVISTVLAFLTASSTPIGGLILGLVLWAAFPYRRVLFQLRWWIAVFLVIIHFASKSGLHGLLFTRVSFVSGSTGYHRYRLIQAAIDQLPEWALFGTSSTYHWGWGLDDVTCQYVAAAVTGGLTLLLLLVFLLVRGAGAAWRIGGARSSSHWESWLSWGIIVSIAVHAICFLAGTYFGEVVFLFWFTIGSAASLGESISRPARIPSYREGPEIMAKGTLHGVA